ncbi:phosphate ABC transporter substrate-binding protein PstS [uncultured Victivallis sp.]|uniref:phosphate ABC transporter substrate-binding protein PstS n=1 Tax=uncultured Victivallis sp. TaxID=354118 RepID=UPI0025EF26C8|nr:phosphate ABC transporter substrate-binding protein PstS [uncultured Victivallis sp.]
MKKLFGMAAATLLSFAVTAAEISLDGAGASFPAPVYRVWSYNYGESTGNRVEVNYQSSGSGAGINQIKEKTIDFGGSDNPLTKEELDKANLCQFPMLAGGVVVIVNLRGVKPNTLKLDQATLADIFLGKIKGWDDPRIKALNPGVKLPRVRITVVRRSDSSGTSFIFTNYLSKISKEWADRVGCGPAVNWPVGIGGQKNPGVCNNVARINGAIGYTEYTYAVEAKLSMVSLKNKAGKFVEPKPETFRASGAHADWKNAPGFYMLLTDQPGDDSWPITGLTYILVQRNQPDAKKAAALLNYFNWCYTTGASAASKLHYVPLPEEVVSLVRNAWDAEIRSGNASVKY